MALSRFYLRNVRTLAYNGIICKFNGVPLWPAARSSDFPDFGIFCWNIMHSRCYWNKKRKVPRAPPTKPLNFDYSGDSTHYTGKVDYSQPKLGFEGLPELENAEEMVRKIFSLEYSTQREVLNKVIADLTDKIKNHPFDVKSLELNIARDTVNIRSNIKWCLANRKDKVKKLKLMRRIFIRNANLKKLQAIDIEKFDWLTSELQLRIMQKKEPTLTKREVRTKAARDAKEALMRQKTEELRMKLDEERQKFDEYRAAELADIEQSLRELGIEMKSLEQTLTDLGASDRVPRPVPWVSLEQLMKQRKIAQLMEIKKKTDAETLHNYGFIVPKSLLS